MFLAVFDYVQYIRRRGRYGNNQTDGGMALAYSDKLPDNVVNQLRLGDIIFTQRFDSVMSWAMMYTTSSPVDHVAIYCGNGEIMHVTLDGTKKHSLRSLTRGARSLPTRPLLLTGQNPGEPPPGRAKLTRKAKISHILPPKWQLIWVGVLVIHGFFHKRFRWKFAVDLFISALMIDTILYAAFGVLVAIPMFAFSLSIILFNLCRFFVVDQLGLSYELLSHPDIGYYGFFRNGGVMYTNIGPLVVVRPIGILPLKAFLALSRQRTDDGATNEFQEFRQFICDVIEDLDIGSSTEQSEYHDSNKDNVEED